VTTRDVDVVRTLASRLLPYPSQSTVDQLPTYTAVAGSLPQALADPILRFVDYLTVTELLAAQQHYVATFDLKRKCCLYLSYYLNGDTRRRGMALVGFKEVYRSAGLQLQTEELPDYLPVVLEFAVAGDRRAAEDLLGAHRRGLTVLRTALAELGSPYADLVDAVELTLPPPGAHDLESAAVLAVQGPPREEVGLEPFGPPEMTGLGVRS
jgi:nitrate reductase molybdenum cofactor assembly chaperone NarJ/NarW